MAFQELKAALRAALATVFGDNRLEKTLDEATEQFSEALRASFDGHVQPHDEHLDQIAALSPLNGRIIVGDGSRWVLGDACDCVQEHVDAEHPHAQYMRAADAIERFAVADHEHAYEAAGTMDVHLGTTDPHPGRYEPAGSVDAHASRADNPHGVTAEQVGAAPAAHTHEEYEPAGTMSTHLAATNPHGLTPGSIGAAAQLHVHPQYQVTSQKGSPNGYAGLDGSGRVPAAQLPAAAYASTSTTADFGPASGTANPFAGVAVQHQVTAEGITYNGTLGRWTVATAGVYEVSAMLPISASEAGPVTVIVGGLAVEGLAADTQRRPVAVTVLRSLAASGTVDVIVGAGGSALVTVGAGATVSIRRIA